MPFLAIESEIEHLISSKKKLFVFFYLVNSETDKVWTVFFYIDSKMLFVFFYQKGKSTPHVFKRWKNKKCCIH